MSRIMDILKKSKGLVRSLAISSSGENNMVQVSSPVIFHNEKRQKVKE
jgi:hypothetical protein